MIISFLEEHYKLLTGIIVPVIIAIIGLLARSQIKKSYNLKGTSNNLLTAEKDINNNQSFNTVSQNNSTIQVAGNNNQISNFDLNAIQILVQSFNKTMYPYAERGFEKFRLNSQNFLANLNSQLEQLSSSELEKFSEADVQMALYKAMQGAGRTDSVQVHKVLGQLIADRVQKPKRIITELTINEAIEITAKLDVNLVKILAFSFLFSRTKYLGLLNETALAQKLSLATNEFKDLETTPSRFEYLEAISCGKFLQFISNGLLVLISKGYPQLFIKKISAQQLAALALPAELQNICFIQNDSDSFQLNPYIGLYLFEDTPVSIGNSPFTITDDAIKEQLKNFISENRLSNEEIQTYLLQIPLFENIIRIWDTTGLAQFSLTAVGIAIGRAYLEQVNMGSYDINTWIN